MARARHIRPAWLPHIASTLPRCSLPNRRFSSAAAASVRQTASATPPANLRFAVGGDHVKIFPAGAEDSSVSLSHEQLRENCRCSECYIGLAHQRKGVEIGQGVKVESIRPLPAVPGTGHEVWVELTFSDGHHGILPIDLTPPLLPTRIAKTLWQHTPQAADPIDYTTTLHDDAHLLALYEQLERNGLVRVFNAPRTAGAVKTLAERLGGMVRPTVYGETFHVTANRAPDNQAYTSLALPPHTDLPYLDSPPGVFLFHCRSPAQQGGGLSTYVDGFYVAEKMRREHPEEFETLTQVKVPFRDVPEHHEWDLMAEHSTIAVEHRIIKRITFNEAARYSLLAWAVTTPQMDAFYSAIRTFRRLVSDPSHTHHIAMGAGEITVFDNHRVLHGRTAFTGGGREMEGGYLEWSNVRGFMRRIMRRHMDGTAGGYMHT
ncbi:unnamed protein product [Vitrella brassicaformis CCMP3155]|uniref:trimethyllysine dioxygenase n=1 Tax=Vitrella brassicaformis (strain CCMP3155) TaxID=1169540 RepID=A0A0G4GRW5_VITBC|nr:unnamed protein product [Vitrella brassicaformis CCMP3155]|eukprot:CEM33099.1 unnamed protein product [Vitrella brassicaformis CCMP3155]